MTGPRETGGALRRRSPRISSGNLAFSAVASALGACGGPEIDAGRPSKGDPPPVVWERSVDDAFERARAEARLVLLYVEATWCHWCHVMDHETYDDPAVRAAIAEGYVPLRVDSDARPDLANRYRRWAWPATVVLAAGGTELAKRRGYVEAPAFARLLRTLRDDPAPETEREPPPAWSTSPLLAEDVRAVLERRHRERYDLAEEGLPVAKKTLDLESLELSMALGARGDAEEERRARATLDRARALVDPVWGGAWQYSHGGVWSNPHFEKIMTVQRRFLLGASEAALRYGDSRYVDVARAIDRWLSAFMTTPEGAFRTSQDADVVPGVPAADYFRLGDRARREVGIPKIDANVYARENGLAVEGLVALYEATGDAAVLERAEEAAVAIDRTHRLDGGGYRHGAGSQEGPFLADSLAMARAWLALHRATGDPARLDLAAGAADFVDRTFRAPDGPGYRTAAPGGPFEPIRVLDENLDLARFANLLHHYTGEPRHREIAERAMTWLATPDVALSRLSEPGLLLADRELSAAPISLLVTGAADDPAARSLHLAALRVPGAYKRVEREVPGRPLRRGAEPHPVLDRAAVWICTERSCSPPIFDPEEVGPTARRLTSGETR